MTPEQEHLARQRGHEVALLRWHWDGAYEFGYDGTAYWARRADTGNVLSDPDLAEFREMVRMDYCHCPAPEGHHRGLMSWAGVGIDLAGGVTLEATDDLFSWPGLVCCAGRGRCGPAGVNSWG